MAADNGSVEGMGAAIAEVSERLQLLVREEIELAKAEVQTKVTRLLKGVVVAAAAGIFVITALLFLLHGFAWLAWYALPVGNSAIFWGFFVVAGILLLLGALAGYLAFRFIRSSSPPTPELAIDEARLIRETLRPPETPVTVPPESFVAAPVGSPVTVPPEPPVAAPPPGQLSGDGPA
ncbi:MAG: phage holin family protein [Solirubrobacteraceae bacterium]|nr:MAG: hypothetical protein DLM63_06385 [Solirubrobacterales bacterium]